MLLSLVRQRHLPATDNPPWAAILEDINHHAPKGDSIDVHMAMSVSCAVTLGMVRNTKADRAFNLFDRNNDQDTKVMTI